MSATFAAYEARIDAIRAAHPQMPRTTVVRLRLLHNVLRLLADDLELFFSGQGVSASGWSALMMIYSAPEMRANPSLLSTELLQSRTHMTRIADELVGKGLVKREPNTLDRRRIDLVLTRRGREFIERLLPGAWAHYGELLDVFDLSESKTLEQLMRKLHAHLSGSAATRSAQRVT